MMLERDALRTIVVDALGAAPALAAWEGGSTAFDRDDELSDLDICAVAEPGAVERVFAAVERAITPLGIRRRWVVPEPAWHGHSQRFYQFEHAYEGLLLDLLVQDGPGDKSFLQRERHGASRVLFDPQGHLAPEPFDRASHEQKMHAELARHRDRFDILQPLVRKEIARGNLLDAVAFHNRLTVEPLVFALNVRHRPDQYDFGMRYLYELLPQEDIARLERIVAVGDLDQLAASHADAVAWFHELTA